MENSNNSSCQNSKKWVPIQQLPNGEWQLSIKMEHLDFEDLAHPVIMYHNVTYFHRPTLEDIKRTCLHIAMAYLGEVNYGPDTFDFSPYLVY